MSIMTPVIIPPAPPAPSRSDPETFEERNDAAVAYQFETLPAALNQVSLSAYENAVAAQASAKESLSNAHFKGRWSSLSGALATPASVYHYCQYWQLLDDLTDVTQNEPMESSTHWVVSVIRVAEQFEVGDYRDTIRPLGDEYLRRDGAMYPIADYPELASYFKPVPPGYRWEEISLSSTDNVRDVIRAGVYFYAIVSDGTDTFIYRSISNGALFDFVATVTGMDGRSIAYSPDSGAFVLTGADRKIATSADGETWSAARVVTQATTGTDSVITSAIYFNGAFLATTVQRSRSIFGVIIKSTDNGATWSVVYTYTGGTSSSRTQGLSLWASSDRVYGVGNPMTAGTFVTVMSNAAVTSFSVQITSASARVAGVYTDQHIAIVGDANKIQSSQDGISWSDVVTLEGNGANSVKAFAYANNKLLFFDGGSITSRYRGAHVSDKDADVWERSEVPNTDFNGGDDWHPGLRPAISEDGSVVMIPCKTGNILRGVDVPQAYFRVPEDNPIGGWIKALNV